MSFPVARFAQNERPTVRTTWRVASGLWILAALALAAAPAMATTYKWTDANGRVIYSDQPPPGNVKVESIAAPPPPANPNAVKELANKEADLQQKKLLRADEEAKATKARLEADKKRDQCGKVRGQMIMLQSGENQIYRSNDKGQQVYMDDVARRRELEQLGTWVRENCSA
jgi:Skp family chaperone for outer membrane proteins